MSQRCYDFYISYEPESRIWVRWIEGVLIAKGKRVAVPGWEMGKVPTGSQTRPDPDLLRDSARMLIVWSPQRAELPAAEQAWRDRHPGSVAVLLTHPDHQPPAAELKNRFPLYDLKPPEAAQRLIEHIQAVPAARSPKDAGQDHPGRIPPPESRPVEGVPSGTPPFPRSVPYPGQKVDGSPPSAKTKAELKLWGCEVGRYRIGGWSKRSTASPAVESKSEAVSYRIVDWISADQGGMGEVYVAEREPQRVAIKLIKESERDDWLHVARFERETQILATLRHAGICGVHDWGIDHRLGPFLVMEHLDGQTLRVWLAKYQEELRGSSHDERASRAILMQLFLSLGRAVRFMHGRGCYHRDLKPENVMVLCDPGAAILKQVLPPMVKLLDFGMAKATTEAAAQDTLAPWLTKVRDFLPASVNYRAPEHTLVPASDVYSLGVMLYEAVQGRPPFEGDTTEQVRAAHLVALPPPITMPAPKALKALISRMLYKEREIKDRPTAGGFVSALEEILQRGGRRGPLLPAAYAIGAVGALVALTLAPGVQSCQQPRPGPPDLGSTDQAVTDAAGSALDALPTRDDGPPDSSRPPPPPLPREPRLDITEVTAKKYRSCVDKGGCSPPEVGSAQEHCTFGMRNRDLYPINCVTQAQARQFCAWRGGELPTLAQWQQAAFGASEPVRPYPWGSEDPVVEKLCWNQPGPCTTQAGRLGRQDQTPGGKGVRGMAGNVAEWVAEGGYCGGSWATQKKEQAQPWCQETTNTVASDAIGFRCVSRPPKVNKPARRRESRRVVKDRAGQR